MRPSTLFARAALPIGLLILGGCKAREKEPRAAARKGAPDTMAKGTQPAAPAVGPGAVADSVGGGAVAGDTVRPRPDTVAVFTRFAGYAVRGTDEWSFKVCRLPKVHFLRPDPFPNAELNQRYRFRASRVLIPVYFEIRGRVVPDTVTMGVNTYTSVMEVKEVFPEVEGAKPDCPPPGRGSLIARQR